MYRCLLREMGKNRRDLLLQVYPMCRVVCRILKVESILISKCLSIRHLLMIRLIVIGIKKWRLIIKI